MNKQELFRLQIEYVPKYLAKTEKQNYSQFHISSNNVANL